MRTRIAADLHDDIGSGLSQIAVLSEVVRQQFGVDGQASEPLAKIAGTAGELVDSMSDIVWAVNPSKDHLGDLVHRMRRFASDVLTARNVVLGFRADGLDSARRVAPDFRRHVYLILKEAVNNAAKHSGCARVDVAMEFTQQGLFLQVQDDGRGFDPAAGGEGHGLSTLQQRAGVLGDRLEIVSQPGLGTTLTARLPMSQRGSALRCRLFTEDGTGIVAVGAPVTSFRVTRSLIGMTPVAGGGPGEETYYYAVSTTPPAPRYGQLTGKSRGPGAGHRLHLRHAPPPAPLRGPRGEARAWGARRSAAS